ncbi:PAS domain-containing protein [Deinococcus altitudinis]|uniref:PAS domain-containing protein n=1 Tax=Deinococcus altitudinis TaxID=468914 RepID=UPI0038916C3A
MNNDSSKPQSSAAEEFALEVNFQALEAQVVHLHSAVTRLQLFFRDSPAALFILDDQGRILDVNTRGAALLRSTRDILLRRTLVSSLVSSSRTTFASLLKRVFEGQEQQRSEVQ